MIKIVLAYYDHIPSGSKTGKAPIKHEIRRRFSDQLYKVWQKSSLLKQYWNAGLPAANHRANHFCVPTDPSNPFLSIPLFGLNILPLVSAHNRLTCELDIKLLVAEPHLLSPTGDLDNRIKIVFDALRMPHEEQDVPLDQRGVGSSDLFCLLEDDSMIRKFCVEANEANSSPMVEELKVEAIISSTSESHEALVRF